MNASISQIDLIEAAKQFALPEIRIVNPKLVICLGLVTFNALRQASDLAPCYPMELAMKIHSILGAAVFGVRPTQEFLDRTIAIEDASTASQPTG